MRARFIFASALTCLALPSGAWAASNVVVISQPSLLKIGDVQQSVSATYTLNQRSTSSGTTSAESTSERYVLSTSLTVVDPELLNIDFSAGANYQTSLSGTGSSSTNAAYNILASGLRVSSTPFAITSSRNTSFIANGYIPPYSVTSTSTLFSTQLHHDVLPLQFSYGHIDSSTSGLANDYDSSSDSLWLAGIYILGRSTTNSSLSYSREATLGRLNKSYRWTLDNASALDTKRNYQLNTHLNVNQTNSGEVPSKTISVSETLNARLGAALTGGVVGQFTDSSTVDFNGADQSQNTTLVTGFLSHQLFQSLTTTLAGNYGVSHANGGGSTTYGESVGLGYRKQLIADSSLGVNFSYARSMTTQELLSSQIAVRDESHRVTQQGEFLVLNQQGTLGGIIIVRSLNPDITYVEDVDFRVDRTLGRIEIVVAGGIAPGTELLISYDLAINPDIKYQTDTYSTSVVMNFLGNRYTVSGNLTSNNEKLLSGNQSNAPLSKSTNYQLRGDANYNPLRVGAEYVYSDSTSQSYSKIGVHVLYSYSFSTTDSVNASFSNDYFMYPDSGAGGAGYSSNALSGSASYSGLFWQSVRTAASMSVTDSRSRYGNSDTVMSRLSVGRDFRRLSLSLDATNLYRMSRETTRDTSIVVKVVRSF